jgi:hypothetical protein
MAVKTIPAITLVHTYAANSQMLPFCNIKRASFENVEKVVNPPQMPTIRKRARLLFSL